MRSTVSCKRSSTFLSFVLFELVILNEVGLTDLAFIWNEELDGEPFVGSLFVDIGHDFGKISLFLFLLSLLILFKASRGFGVEDNSQIVRSILLWELHLDTVVFDSEAFVFEEVNIVIKISFLTLFEIDFLFQNADQFVFVGRFDVSHVVNRPSNKHLSSA